MGSWEGRPGRCVTAKTKPPGRGTPAAAQNGRESSMTTLHEPRFAGKCIFSERWAANLQPFIGLLEAEWRGMRSTMDPLTEALFRQAHDALSRLYENHVCHNEGRRA